jgi:hypothetical protein
MSSMPVPSRRRAFALAALVAPMLSACGGTDPFAPVATLYTGLNGYVLYPLSTAPPLLPTGLQLLTQAAVRPQVSSTLGLNFDLVFDRNAQGQLRVIPPKLIATVPTGTPATGIQTVTTPFDSLLRAPSSGYQYDSATVVRTGQVFAVAAQGTTSAGITCSSSAPIYAKMIIDSVVAAPEIASHRIYVRTVTDPNCGFRSLETGVIPKS